MYVHYPELWRELKDMDNRAYNKFKGKGVDYYEQKIIQKLRNKQMSLFNKAFEDDGRSGNDKRGVYTQHE